MLNTIIKTPIGNLSISILNGLLVRCKWTVETAADTMRSSSGSMQDIICLNTLVRQLKEYFEGNVKQFDLPTDLKGTAFQLKVWKELGKIPYGEKITYSELSERIGQPTACRAVANACGKNPLAIIYPCHRVIGSGNKTGGYTGGVEKKTFMIKLESENK